MILDKDFYIRNTKKVAQDLLGKVLYHKNSLGHISCGRIFETEVYLGIKDPACHTNGPGKLCRQLAITREHNGLKLWKKSSGLWIEDDGYKQKPKSIIKVPRFGVDYAGDAASWPLQFYVDGSVWVSRI